MLALLLLLQVQDSAAVVPGQGSPTAPIPRIEGTTINIDGAFDEPAWSQATRLTGFSQYQPVDGRPAEEQTEVLVWYAPDAIYFGVLAHDRDPAGIRATVADRDNIDNDDQVIIDLDTFNDHRRAFLFAVNPLGSQSDGVRSEGGGNASSIIPGAVDKNPDFTWESKGRLTDQGYQVEIRIPFKSLRFPGSGPQTWGLQVTRVVQRTGYTDTWTDVRRASASLLGQEGAISGLHDLRRGVVIEVQPFATATADGQRNTATGEFARESVNPDAGANLRLGFTSFALDGTYHPDFSQVESDAGQVTVNERFALFFPEKRPFFLEGIELFSSPNQLVYTRRIVDPKGGLKLTGKFGQLGVAHLTAVDQRTGDDAWFNVTRLRRDFGTNSIAGVTLTNRDQGGAFNRVLAGDFRYVWSLYYVQLQYGGSWTRSTGPTVAARIWQAEYDRTGRGWGFNYWIAGLGDGFDAQAGFVNRQRSGVVIAHAFNRFTLYGARGALVENFTVYFGPARTWNYADFGSRAALEGADSVDAIFRLRGGWKLNAHGERAFVNFTRSDYAAYTIGSAAGPAYVPAGNFDGPLLQGTVTTPTWRQANASLTAGYGRAPLFEEGVEGTRKFVSGDVTLRPSPTLRVTATGAWVRFRRLDVSEFAREVIPRLKLEYQPSRSLFFRAIGEYRSERRAGLRDPATGQTLYIGGAAQMAQRFNGLRLDFLASLEPTPGTVAFLGYGSSLEADREFSISRLSRQSDGFFVKLAYQLRK